MTDASHDDTEDQGERSSRLRVRPYTVTRGRTDTEVDLSIESMIHAANGGNAPAGSPSEAQAIFELCREAQSVAEISAHLHLPLQVAKVLVGDLITAGAVTTNRGGHQADGRPDLALLERVLDGLQSL